MAKAKSVRGYEMLVSKINVEQNMRQFHIYAMKTLRFAALAARSEQSRSGKQYTELAGALIQLPTQICDIILLKYFLR